ncbi:MAG: biotin/lipoyl-containing protein, partial [Achromobacter pestifer]
MGIHIIKMPDIGEGIAEVELVGWHVKVGDTVAEDQPLADVMTDKATVEIPSPVVGKVVALGGDVGQVMAVGGELIRLEVEGEGNARAGTPAPQKAAAAAVEASTPAPAKADNAAAATAGGNAGQIAASVSPQASPA